MIVPGSPPTLAGLERLVPDPDALALLDERLARRHGVLPLGLDAAGGCLTLALAGAPDLLRRGLVGAAVGPDLGLRWVGATAAMVTAGIERCYPSRAPLDALVAGLPGAGLPGGAGDAPIVQLIDALLHDAVVRGASDLHLAPGETEVRARLRVGGVLATRARLPAELHPALAVRLKVMAGLDIAETRRPQDGGFRRWVRGVAVDFRLSSFPLDTGESLVLRVLDAAARPVTLAALGLGRALERELRRAVERPGGLVLVAGPTGSGKSTTLHALVAALVDESLHVVTLEDPVEYPIDGVAQASVDPARGLDFADGVRALLRQDPDVILIGEIRDAASCRMAFRAAMSGHRVLATVHAHGAVAALARLRELGAAPSVMGATLAGVVGQRLLRKPCTRCASEVAPADGSCGACRGSGYAGRFALVEVLAVRGRIGAAIAAGERPETIAGLAADEGFVSLEDAAGLVVVAGRTTREEATRVLGAGWHGTGRARVPDAAPDGASRGWGR